MGETVTFRVPRELKERMRRCKINWSEILRKTVEETIRKYELSEAAKIADEIRNKTKYGVFNSVKAIREDRGR